jgi:hypothetical protein
MKQALKYYLAFVVSLTCTLCSLSSNAQVQHTYGDTSKLEPLKLGAGHELQIINSTKNTVGFLVNYGNGKTKFKLGLDSAWSSGDTLKLRFTDGTIFTKVASASAGSDTIPTLQSVTHAGNSTDTSITITDGDGIIILRGIAGESEINVYSGPTFNRTTIKPGLLQLVHDSARVEFNSISSFHTYLKYTFPTANRNLYLPNKDGTLATFNDIPTNVSAFTNDAGYLTTISGIAAGGDLAGTYPNPTVTWANGYTTYDARYLTSTAQNKLISGGVVAWLHDYVYNVSAATYLIDGTQYSSPSTDITLSAADVTDDRIDLFVLTTSSTAIAITGTPSTPAAAPDYDANTQLQISFATVTASSTEPVVTNEWIYKENTEWTTSASAGTINTASTNNPYAGTKDVEGSAVANGTYVSFTSVTTLTIGNYENLIFEIRSKANWGTAKKWIIRFYNGTTAIGNSVSFGSSSYGFVSSATSQYQNITIPLSDFGSISTATAVRITQSNTSGTVGWYLDNVQLQGNQGGGTPQTITIVGDVSGAGSNTINATVSGIRNKVVPALSTGFLTYTGSVFAFDNSTYVPITRTVAGFALSGNITLATHTAGYGLTGSSYNGSTARTWDVDSLLFSTRAWRDKLKDSLGILIDLKQNQLNGTGFVKATGTTISYDNSTYLTANQSVTVTATGDATGTSSASGTAPSLPLTLATVNGNVGTFTNATVTVNAKGLITAVSTGSGGGITSLNSQTGATQTFATPGTSGSDPNWSSGSNIHTLNIPLMAGSGVNSGLLSNSSQVIPGAKEFTNSGIKFSGLSTGSSSHKLVVTDDATGQIYKISPGSYTGFIVDQYAASSVQRAWIDTIKALKAITDSLFIGQQRYPNMGAFNMDSTGMVRGIYLYGDARNSGTYNRYVRMYWLDTSNFKMIVGTNLLTTGKNFIISDGQSTGSGNKIITLDYGSVILGRSGSAGGVTANLAFTSQSDANMNGGVWINGAQGLHIANNTTKQIVADRASTNVAGIKLSITGQDAGAIGIGTGNLAGGNIEIIPGMGTGTGTSNTIFKTSPGTASAGTLNTAVTQMTISSDRVTIDTKLSLSSPIITTGTTPSNSLSTGAGTGATASITGNSVGGVITINTGTGCVSTDDIITVTFATALTNTPKAIIITAANQTAGGAMQRFYVNANTASTTAFTIKNTATVLSDSQTYKLYYYVIQ